MAFRKRTGSYKKCNLQPSHLQDRAPHWLERLQTLRQNQDQNSLHPAEFVAQFLLEILQELRPKDWRGQKHLSSLKLPLPLLTFHEYSLRGIPQSVNNALVNWYLGRYPLQLFFYKPSPEEVLLMQVQGKRCVTVFDQPQDWLQLHDGRDAYSFILHDLVHADHFFAKPEWQEGQILFYQKCLQLWRSPEITKMMAQDLQFSTQFEYAFSDMNSHPTHLDQYLQAIMAQAQQRQLL